IEERTGRETTRSTYHPVPNGGALIVSTKASGGLGGLGSAAKKSPRARPESTARNVRSLSENDKTQPLGRDKNMLVFLQGKKMGIGPHICGPSTHGSCFTAAILRCHQIWAMGGGGNGKLKWYNELMPSLK
ncbi:hypothetical protein I7I51_03273, partial [Histoplasma capsulatum]